MNAEESKGIVFERREEEIVDFSTPYSVPTVGRCEVLK